MISRIRSVIPLASQWIPRRWIIGLLLVLTALSSLMESVVVALIAATATTIVDQRDRIELALGPIDISWTATSIIVLGLVMTVLSGLIQYLYGFVLARFGTAILSHARLRYLTAYLDTPYEMQRSILPAELQDIFLVRTLRTMQVVVILIGAVAAVIAFAVGMVVAIVIAPLLASALLAATLVLSLGLRPLFRSTLKSGTSAMTLQTDLGVVLGDVPGLLAETHIYSAHHGMIERTRRAVERGSKAIQDAQMASHASQSLYGTLLFGTLLVGLLVADGQGINDPAALGAVVLLMMRGSRNARQAQSSLQAVAELLPNLTSLSTSFAEIDAAHAADGTESIDAIDVIEFDRVGYRYAATGDGVEDLDVRLERGQLIGIVGISGAGKSTFAELVMGLRDPHVGTIRVNGVDRRTVARRSWFEFVAYVGQEPRLFDGTVAANIEFFRDLQATGGRGLDEVVRLAALDGEIARWPEGTARNVGVAGADLSGGQRQRAAIARSLIGSPDLYVFDEPTSALDSDSETAVRDTIDELRKHAIVLVISHRDSTLSQCDRILRFSGGTIVSDTPADAVEAWSDDLRRDEGPES